MENLQLQGPLSIHLSVIAQCDPYGKLPSIDLVKVQSVFGNHGRLGDGWRLLLVHIGMIQNSDAITLIVSCTSLLGQ